MSGLHCAHPKCRRQPTILREVFSWFAEQRLQTPVEYVVCDKHDREYFGEPFNGDKSERVREELNLNRGPLDGYPRAGRRSFGPNGWILDKPDKEGEA